MPGKTSPILKEIRELGRRVGNLEHRMDGLEHRMDRFEGYALQIRDSLLNIQTVLASALNLGARVEDHERRIALLEGQGG